MLASFFPYSHPLPPCTNSKNIMFIIFFFFVCNIPLHPQYYLKESQVQLVL